MSPPRWWQRLLERSGAPWRDALVWFLVLNAMVGHFVGDLLVAGGAHFTLWLVIAFLASRLWFLEKAHRRHIEEHEAVEAATRQFLEDMNAQRDEVLRERRAIQ